MHTIPVGVIGGSGYTGMETTSLLAGHPRVELRFVSSDRWQGEPVATHIGASHGIGDLHYSPLERSGDLARACEAVFLATPAETSLRWVPSLSRSDACIVDLSGAFRLKNRADYLAFYGFEHPHPQLAERAVYGLPELFRKQIAGARLIANPGCYATAASLAAAPLIAQGLLDDGSLVFDAASGTTGAGRKESVDFSFSEVAGDFRAYRVLKHQHTPEIEETLSRCSVSGPVRLTFTAHLLPIRRGILCTAYARLQPGKDGSEVMAALKARYGSEPFVSLLSSPDEVALKNVIGTNRCAIGAAFDNTGRDPRRVVLVSAIDNLVKGAAGQAIQNLNLAMGWPETEGLGHLRGFYP